MGLIGAPASPVDALTGLDDGPMSLVDKVTGFVDAPRGFVDEPMNGIDAPMSFVGPRASFVDTLLDDMVQPVDHVASACRYEPSKAARSPTKSSSNSAPK
jgi:hypothetical protein